MKYIVRFLIITFIFITACNRTKDTNAVSDLKDSVSSSHRITNILTVPLKPKAALELKNWKEYGEVDKMIKKYKNVSRTEALANGLELSQMVQLMKDSVRVETLKRIDVKARINVLHNETLRLADMANIPAITDDEIKEEVSKIFFLFAALNSKINTIYQSEEIKKTIEVDSVLKVDSLKKVKETPKRVRPNKRSLRKTKQ